MTASPHDSRPLSELKPPNVLNEITLETNPQLFLRIDNHLIAFDRIAEVGYVPKDFAHRVDGIIYSSFEVAKRHAFESSGKIEDVRGPSITIYFNDVVGNPDFVRRYGQDAQILWDYLTMNFAVP